MTNDRQVLTPCQFLSSAITFCLSTFCKNVLFSTFLQENVLAELFYSEAQQTMKIKKMYLKAGKIISFHNVNRFACITNKWSQRCLFFCSLISCEVIMWYLHITQKPTVFNQRLFYEFHSLSVKVKNQLCHGIISLFWWLKAKMGQQKVITASIIHAHPHVILLTNQRGISREKGLCLQIVMQIKISCTHTAENQAGRNPIQSMASPGPLISLPKAFLTFLMNICQWSQPQRQSLCSSNWNFLAEGQAFSFSILKMHLEKILIFLTRENRGK